MSEVPVGTVCAYAGAVTPSRQGKNTLWSGTDCGAAAAADDVSDAAAAERVALIEAQGWMLCDGRFLGVAQCPELFGALGYTYGEGQDARGQKTFRIPDYRGLFLRGVDDGAQMDPDASQRVGPQGHGTDAGIGSLQCDALQTHTHQYNAVQTATPAKEGQAGAFTTSAVATSPPNKPARISSSETRPRNVAVNYVIKYRTNRR
jgi:microcystin-dependent protein